MGHVAIVRLDATRMFRPSSADIALYVLFDASSISFSDRDLHLLAIAQGRPSTHSAYRLHRESTDSGITPLYSWEGPLS